MYLAYSLLTLVVFLVVSPYFVYQALRHGKYVESLRQRLGYLPIAFNDIDFCLRLREAGWEIVWTPYAELYHHESTSRGLDTIGPRAAAFAREVAYMETRWGFRGLRSDPYYNPNLSLDAENYTLAWPPRVPLVPDPSG